MCPNLLVTGLIGHNKIFLGSVNGLAILILILNILHFLLQAWLIMSFSFLCNGVIFGIINSSGVLFVYLKKGYKGDKDVAATKVYTFQICTNSSLYELS